MLEIRYGNQFKKDYKLIKKRGYDINKLKSVIEILARQEKLPQNIMTITVLEIINGFRECHIEPKINTKKSP